MEQQRFQGFSEASNEFLWGIRLNNERSWFQEHRQEYIDHVQNPLRALAEALEIPRERVMAVGDGLNDRTLLEAAGLAVAMGNAHPAIKAIADYVTDDCDHDGAAKAIERFCLS